MPNLENLKPYDSERAREAARKHGFGSGKHKQCEGLTRSGERCKSIAMLGTPKCIKHGARRYKGTPQSPYRHLNDARAIRDAAPDEVRRTEAWQTAESRTPKERILAQAELAAAWQTAQEGDWQAWRTLTK